MMYFGILYTCFFCNLLASVISSKTNLNNLLTNSEFDFIDLSYSFDKHTIYWPDSKSFEFTKKDGHFNEDGSWYAANDFEAGEHGGTHLDAPYHFAAAGRKVDEIPLENLIVPLIIADVSSIVNDDPNFVLYKHHLDYLINNNMGKPCLIVFKFGWSKYANDRDKYLGIKNTHNNRTLNFPGLSGEVVEWITTSYKNVVGIGVDVASIDPGSSTEFPAHKIACAAGLYNLENVKLDTHVPEFGCTAIVMPMKIAMGSGAPTRLVAICPKQLPTDFSQNKP